MRTTSASRGSLGKMPIRLCAMSAMAAPVLPLVYGPAGVVAVATESTTVLAICTQKFSAAARKNRPGCAGWNGSVAPRVYPSVGMLCVTALTTALGLLTHRLLKLSRTESVLHKWSRREMLSTSP